jgi:phage shock protein A
MMVDRSRDKIAQMQARSAAVGQLLDSGVLDDPGASGGDDIDRQLGASSGEAAVQAQLDAMKQQIALPASNIVVRVQGEGQFRLAGSFKGELDGYDQKVTAAIEAGQPAALKQSVHDVIAFVKSHGVPVADAENAASQVVLPSEDLTLEEAKKIMAGG